MDLGRISSYGEPGAIVYRADCVEFMRLVPPGCVDMVFADPPYRLSSGGVTVRGGRLAPVDKGEWDRPRGLREDYAFDLRWLRGVRRILKPDGTVWITGTHHNVFSVGFALLRLGFRIIQTIVWEKPDPPPNALHTAFTHAHELLVWASRSRSSRYTFNHGVFEGSGASSSPLTSVWRIPSAPPAERLCGYHPTQKPLRLVRRTILASTREKELVFDPFCGSGTTAVAARELGRAFVGTELEEEFCTLAARRIAASRWGDALHRV